MLNLKHMKLRPLLVHLIVTLLYPVFRACIAETDKLLLFADAITIIGLLMIVGGIIYALYLHGDFDISGYLLKRGVQKEPTQTYFAYLYEVYAKREGAFNYSLFLGLLYLAAALILSWLFL